MAVAFGPTSCSSGLVPKSKLLHSPEAQYGLVPKHSHHGGKNTAYAKKRTCLTINLKQLSLRLFFMFFPLKRLNPRRGNGISGKLI